MSARETSPGVSFGLKALPVAMRARAGETDERAIVDMVEAWFLFLASDAKAAISCAAAMHTFLELRDTDPMEAGRALYNAALSLYPSPGLAPGDWRLRADCNG